MLSFLTVTTSVVEQQNLEASLVVAGSVVARDETLVGSEIANLRITEINVDEGDWVKEGQLLARLSSESLEAQFAQFEAMVEKARASNLLQAASLKEAELMQQDADSKKLRGDKLVASRAISAEEHESLKTTAMSAALKTESMRHSLTVGKVDLRVAEAQRDQIKVQLSQTEIRAPSAGIISRRTAKIGNVVSANAELFRLVANGLIELDAQIAESDLASINVGQRVRVRDSSIAGPFIEGTVRSIAPTVDATTRLAIVHVSLPLNSSLRPGQFVRGEVMIGSYETKVIPDAAILYRDANPYVYVVNSDQTVAQRTIVVGRRQDRLAEVKQGLEAGEQVVLEGSGFLKPGDRIQVADSPLANRLIGTGLESEE